eukprot:5123796-Amphidinium_carterae.1
MGFQLNDCQDHVEAVAQTYLQEFGALLLCRILPSEDVDLLHALVKALSSSGRHVEMRKYVDDVVFVASGPYFAYCVRDSYRQRTSKPGIATNPCHRALWKDALRWKTSK